ncbi:MAG: tautomerase family protein [Pseudomonadales bacterium]
MPIIRIEALVATSPVVEPMLNEVSRAAAAAFDAHPRHFWVTFTALRAGHYLEGGHVRGIDDAHRVAPLVTISSYEGRSDEQIGDCLRAVAYAVGKHLNLDPELVFVEYHELRPGRVYTGGAVRTE